MMGSLALAVTTIFGIIRLLLIVKVLTSWIPPYNRRHPIFKFIDAATEPLLVPFQRIIPAVGGIDISPLIVFMILRFLQDIILRGLI